MLLLPGGQGNSKKGPFDIEGGLTEMLPDSQEWLPDSSYTMLEVGIAGDSYVQESLDRDILLEEEDRRNANLATRKREAHNKYMRFWRSLTTSSRKTPPEVLAKYEEFKNNKERGQLTLLFEDFSQAGEDWQKSTIVQNLKLSSTHMRRGRVNWFTKKQLIKKYDDEAVANMICQTKEAEGKTRVHPECPTEKLYLCFDAEEFIDEETEQLSSSLNVKTELSRRDLAALAGNGFALFRGNHLEDFPKVERPQALTGTSKTTASSKKRIASCSRSGSPASSSSEKKKHKSGKKERKSTPVPKKKRARSSSSSADSSSSDSSSSSKKKNNKKRTARSSSSDSEARNSSRKKTKKKLSKCDSSDSEAPKRKPKGNSSSTKKSKKDSKGKKDKKKTPKPPNLLALAKKVLTQLKKSVTECKGLKLKMKDCKAAPALQKVYMEELSKSQTQMEALQGTMEGIIKNNDQDEETHSKIKEDIQTAITSYKSTALTARRLTK